MATAMTIGTLGYDPPTLYTIGWKLPITVATDTDFDGTVEAKYRVNSTTTWFPTQAQRIRNDKVDASYMSQPITDVVLDGADNDTFSMSGDYRAYFVVGGTAVVSGSDPDDNNGTYTINTVAYGSSKTTITVDGDVETATASLTDKGDIIGLVPDGFSGVVRGLSPNTSYDIKVTVHDPDGVSGSNPQTLTGVSTKVVPPANPASISNQLYCDVTDTGSDNDGTSAEPYNTSSALQTALTAVGSLGTKEGTIIHVKDGVYDGQASNSTTTHNGTAASPIFIRGESRDGTIIESSSGRDSTDSAIVLDGSYWTIENLTVRNANVAILDNDDHVQRDGVVVRNCRIENCNHGIYLIRGSRTKTTVYNNLLIDTRHDIYSGWGASAPEGIIVSGQGIDIAYNTIYGWSDAISLFDTYTTMENESPDFLALPNAGVHVYRNDIVYSQGSAIEMDGIERNGLVEENRVSQGLWGVSLQTTGGGPVYVHRNVFYNITSGGPIKDYVDPSGYHLWHNTSVCGRELYSGSFGSGSEGNNYDVYNNIFVGDTESPGVRVDLRTRSLEAIDYNHYVFHNEATIISNSDMDGNITGWSTFNTPTTHQYSTTQAHSAPGSLKFTVDAEYEGTGQTYTTVTDKVYQVSFRVYPDDSTSVSYRVRKGDNSADISAPTTVSGLTQDAWNLIEFTYTETAGGSLAEINIYSPAGVTGGTWYIDDVYVYAPRYRIYNSGDQHYTTLALMTATEGYETNGTEATGATPTPFAAVVPVETWTINSNDANFLEPVGHGVHDYRLKVGSASTGGKPLWNFNEGAWGATLVTNPTVESNATGYATVGSTTTHERSTTQAHSGSASLKFVADANAEGTQVTYTTVTGQRYFVSFFVFPDSTTNCKVYVRQGDNAGAVVGTTTHANLIQDQWNHINFEYTETGGGSGADLRMMSTGAGTWYVDDVNVYNVSNISRGVIQIGDTEPKYGHTWGGMSSAAGCDGDTFEVPELLATSPVLVANNLFLVNN